MRHPVPESRPRSIRAMAICLALVLAVCGQWSYGVTVDRHWEHTPYNVEIVIAIDTSTLLRQRLAKELPELIANQARIAYGALWRPTIKVAELSETILWSRDRTAISADRLAQSRRDHDKLLLLVVRQSPLGYEIEGVEYDCLLEFWGVPVREETADLAAIQTVAFSTLNRVFSPTALFNLHPEKREIVELRFRGADLPRGSQQMPVAKPGQVMRPYLREVDREGIPVEQGINPVSWTYLSVDPPNEEPKEKDANATPKNAVIASVYSHTRAPFGSRRRGRVEQIAIAIEGRGQVTELRLHARDGVDNPLVGFEVFQQLMGQTETVSLGKTDRDGRIVIPEAETPIQYAMVRSGGQWLARIPVVAGYDGLIEAPLADDSRRLEAAERLAAIQEELIDVVARRKLIEARVKGMIQQKQFKEATELVDQLDRLPNITYFQQERLGREAMLVKSSDPRVQQRIDAMFEATRAVLGDYLAPGLVQELRSQIAAAANTAKK